MIKIISARALHDYVIAIQFSDGACGDYDAAPLIAKKTALTQQLANRTYFNDFFVDLGALCWRNGFELSPGSIYRELEAQNKLAKHSQAA
ncbi:MAG: DUF2442 domain-containing protein [Burkholderiales bacterium]